MDTSSDVVYPTRHSPTVVDEDLAQSSRTGDEVKEAASSLTQISAARSRDHGRGECSPHISGKVDSIQTLLALLLLTSCSS